MPGDLTDPITVALLAAEAFRLRGIGHALYGGLALAAYGEPRETRDADLAVLGSAVSAAKSALEARGLQTTVSFTDVPFGGLRISRHFVIGGAVAAGVNVIDLIVPMSDRFASAVLDRALKAPLRGTEISIVSPEDFVLLKVLSTRDRDLDDAASVLHALSARLDFPVIAREEIALAAEIPGHPVRERLAEARGRATRPQEH